MPDSAKAGIRPFHSPRTWTALLVFAVALPLLVANAAPGISFHDSGEFALAASCYGLTHPPGAPTWTLLAGPFAHAFGFSDFARAANCFSALMGAAALALVFVLSDLLLAILHPTLRAGGRTMAALLAPVFLLNSESFLEQSFTAEQYTLLTALLLLFCIALVRALTAQSAESGDGSARTWMLASGAVAGLAIGNHPSQVCLLVGLGLLVIHAACKHGTRGGARCALWCCAGLVAGLLVFVYLPLCAERRPVLDAVGATSWQRLTGALTRQDYESRAITALPQGFMQELLLSYDLIGELSVVGFALALAGLAALVLRRNLVAWVPFIVIAAYGAGMFLAFVRHNFDVLYLRLYGIRDWHLPLYAAGGLLASIGAAQLVQWRVLQAKYVRFTVLALLVLSGLTMAGFALRDASLRSFTAPQRFLQEMWSALPADSIVLASTDNASMMLSYYSCRTGKATEPQRILHGQLADIAGLLRSHQISEWTTDTKVLAIRALDDPAKQPVKLPRLQEYRIRIAPMFADQHGGAGVLSTHLLPAGFLYHVADHAVTDEEIVQAELAWRKTAPAMYDPPSNARVHRLEREARGLAFWQRAGFFYQREFWLLAKEDYQRALQWMPNNGECWHGLGLSIERTGGDTAAAIAAYRQALHQQGWLPGPAQRLAVLSKEN